MLTGYSFKMGFSSKYVIRPSGATCPTPYSIGTAVLIPNTIATIISDPVFNIGPTDAWWSWILMIGTTASGTFLTYYWVKKRGWIPKKLD